MPSSLVRSRSRGARDRSPGSGRPAGSPRARRPARARRARRWPPRRARRTASTTIASGSSNGRSTFIDTCATPPRSDDADRAHAGQPALAALADQRGDRACVLDRRGRRELQVEGHQRRPRGDERGARGRMHPRRPEVGRAAHARRSLRPPAMRAASRRPRHAAAAQLRAGPRGARVGPRELAVEEDRHLQLLADPVGQRRAPPRRPRPSPARRGRRSARRRARPRADAGRPAPGRAGRGSSRRSRSTATRAPRSSASARSPGRPASVNTERWWSGSEWTSSRRAPSGVPSANAAPIAAIVVSSRPSETFGTASRSGGVIAQRG